MQESRLTVLHDGFIRLPNSTWKGAGVSIPVFSLRSKTSLGTGEFSDIRLLVDWAHKAGLKLIQILPVNDTSLPAHGWILILMVQSLPCPSSFVPESGGNGRKEKCSNY